MNTKIKRIEEEQVMKDGKIIAINYSVWYFNAKRRDYQHGHYKVIPMTVLNFIIDEGNEAITRFQEFDGCLYKRTVYQQEVKTDSINMSTAQEDINDAIRFGWIEVPAETEQATENNTTPAQGTQEKRHQRRTQRLEKLRKAYHTSTRALWHRQMRPRLNPIQCHNTVTFNYQQQLKEA